MGLGSSEKRELTICDGTGNKQKVFGRFLYYSFVRVIVENGCEKVPKKIALENPESFEISKLGGKVVSAAYLKCHCYSEIGINGNTTSCVSFMHHF